jgi:AcrR family transcriptional regulator
MKLARVRREVSTPKGQALKRPGPVGGVRDLNRQKKAQAIRDASLLLFLERGIEAVSVDDIMKAARMAKGSFYRYYADQTALVDDLIAPTRELMTRALETCSRELETAKSPETMVKAYTRIGDVLATLLMEQPGPVRLFLQESRAPAQGARRPIIELSARVARYAIEITQIAQGHGVLKPIPVAVSALTVVGAAERLLLAVLQEEDIGNVLEVPAALTTLILDGLRV